MVGSTKDEGIRLRDAVAESGKIRGWSKLLHGFLFSSLEKV